MSFSLWQHLEAVRRRIDAAEHLLVGVNYDAALMPTAADPDRAVLCEESRDVLRLLAARPHTTVAVLSSLSIHDVRSRVAVEGLTYAGSHGLEIEGPSLHFIHASAARRVKALAWLAAALTRGLDRVPGALVENEGLTILVHCRTVPPQRLHEVHQHVTAATAVAPDCFRVSAGDRFLEIHPRVDWHHGSALRLIADQLHVDNALPMFLGGNADEDAYRSLRDGITVNVGDLALTSAEFALEDPAAAERFLRWLVPISVSN